MITAPFKLRLPNGKEILQIDAAETALQYRNIVTNSCYFKFGVRLFAGMTMVDVGANIGLASLAVQWRCGSVRILAVEPASGVHDALVANLDLHCNDATATTTAVGATNGSSELLVYPRVTSMSTLYHDVRDDEHVTRTFLSNSGFSEDDVDDVADELHSFELQPCSIVTLPELLATHHFDRVDLLKLNVEKAEHDVLAVLGPDDWDRIQQIVGQVHDKNGRLDLFRRLFPAHGYTVRIEQDPLLAGTDIYEFFATRPPD